MKRKQIYLTDQLDQKLSELAAARGIPQSEVIREGLEKYLLSLENKEKEWDQLVQQMKESSFEEITWGREELYITRFRRPTDEK